MAELQWTGAATEARSKSQYGFSIGLTTEPIIILSEEHNRMAFVINNESGICYVKLGDTLAAEDNYTYRLTPHCMVENTYWKGQVSVKHETGNAVISVEDFLGGY